MAARIRAVKTKYPRYSPDHAQTAEQTTAPTMSVDEWLAEKGFLKNKENITKHKEIIHNIFLPGKSLG
jgi:hypothetical protein